MGKLLLLFIVVPAVELVLLIEVGSRIGTLATLGIIVATGIAGAALARRQGLGVLRKVQAEMAANRLPTDALIDGVFILIAGALLLTPGILTDAIGLLCLVPLTRGAVKRLLWGWIERAVRDRRLVMDLHFERFDARDAGEPQVFDVRTAPEPEREDPPRIR